MLQTGLPLPSHTVTDRSPPPQFQCYRQVSPSPVTVLQTGLPLSSHSVTDRQVSPSPVTVIQTGLPLPSHSVTDRSPPPQSQCYRQVSPSPVTMLQTGLPLPSHSVTDRSPPPQSAGIAIHGLHSSRKIRAISRICTAGCLVFFSSSLFLCLFLSLSICPCLCLSPHPPPFFPYMIPISSKRDHYIHRRVGSYYKSSQLAVNYYLRH